MLITLSVNEDDKKLLTKKLKCKINHKHFYISYLNEKTTLFHPFF